VGICTLIPFKPHAFTARAPAGPRSPLQLRALKPSDSDRSETKRMRSWQKFVPPTRKSYRSKQCI